MPGKPKKVCVVGSGNWGSAIAKIVGYNARRYDHIDETVTMYVYEEMIEGKKLTDIINEQHENVKYLPGIKLPSNVICSHITSEISFLQSMSNQILPVHFINNEGYKTLPSEVAVPDLVEASQDADVLIFVIPHQFIDRICAALLDKIKPTAVGLSLIKGFNVAEGGGIDLISHIITRHLKIEVSVLMGANLANEVAAERFCETTIGCKSKAIAPLLRDLIQTDYFRVSVVEDVDAVEVCGALKNIVACAAGFVDGLGLGDNTKAAIIRLGLMEMVKFVDYFYPGSKLSTFFESCGVADLITTCYGGRNRRISEAFVKTGKSIEMLEKELLNGQKLQGPFTAAEVNLMLKNKNMEDKFPLFNAVHRICIGELKPPQLIDCIREHPLHVSTPIGPVTVRCSL